MGIFRKQDETDRNYDALLGTSDDQSVLELTPEMWAEEPSSLILSSEQEVKYSEADLQSRLANLQETNKGLKTKNKTARGKVREACRDLVERQEELTDLQLSMMERISGYKAELLDQAGKLDRKNMQIKDLKKTLAETQDNLSETEFKLADYEDKMALRALRYQSQIEDMDRFANQNAQLDRSISQLKDRLGEANRSLDAALTDNRKLREELNAVTAHRQVLESREDEVRDTLQLANEKLQDMRRREQDALSENTLLHAQNRALISRQEELEQQVDLYKAHYGPSGITSRVA